MCAYGVMFTLLESEKARANHIHNSYKCLTNIHNRQVLLSIKCKNREDSCVKRFRCNVFISWPGSKGLIVNSWKEKKY